MALIIPSIINKSGSEYFRRAGDGPCTISQINLIQHAANDEGRWREGRGGGDRKSSSLGVRRIGVMGCWVITGRDRSTESIGEEDTRSRDE